MPWHQVNWRLLNNDSMLKSQKLLFNINPSWNGLNFALFSQFVKCIAKLPAVKSGFIFYFLNRNSLFAPFNRIKNSAKNGCAFCGCRFFNACFFSYSRFFLCNRFFLYSGFFLCRCISCLHRWTYGNYIWNIPLLYFKPFKVYWLYWWDRRK